MADGYLNFDTKINEKGFNDGISKLGSLGKSGLSMVSKTMTGAIAAVGTGAAAIIKSSLSVVANMEQQVGGVETLFKNSANTVIANANKAYKTAGMSANNYMETVTSFSASLLQSLGGDTAKAASYADRAIVDMSDNANKMGTNMRDIQNAYQGFAKQNYTMLDNLKLGYGGTQEEMKRLISDASKMTDVQKELGVTVDASSLSFGNIVNAISVVQKQMGITGTTSKEAATTIEGSVNSAKAAWENFEAGVISANDLGTTYIAGARDDNYKFGYSCTDNFYAVRGTVSSAAKNAPFWADNWIIEQTGASYKVGDTTVATDVIDSFEISSPYYLGNMSKNGTPAGTGVVGKIYYAQIYSGSNLVADMIPVKKSDGTLCLYDKVRKKYIYNAGTGTVTE